MYVTLRSIQHTFRHTQRIVHSAPPFPGRVYTYCIRLAPNYNVIHFTTIISVRP